VTTVRSRQGSVGGQRCAVTIAGAARHTGNTVDLPGRLFAQLWDPSYAGPAAGSTVVDLNLTSREAVDDTHARVVAAGYMSSVEPWDTFFGARYAIVCDPDGHRIGLKSPLDPSLSYPLEA